MIGFHEDTCVGYRREVRHIRGFTGNRTTTLPPGRPPSTLHMAGQRSRAMDRSRSGTTTLAHDWFKWPCLDPGLPPAVDPAALPFDLSRPVSRPTARPSGTQIRLGFHPHVQNLLIPLELTLGNSSGRYPDPPIYISPGDAQRLIDWDIRSVAQRSSSFQHDIGPTAPTVRRSQVCACASAFHVEHVLSASSSVHHSDPLDLIRFDSLLRHNFRTPDKSSCSLILFSALDASVLVPSSDPIASGGDDWRRPRSCPLAYMRRTAH